MGRVEIASLPWGVVQDRAGNAIQGASVTLKNLDGSPATHYSAETGGSSSTSAISSDVNGTLTGRFIDGGQYLWSSAAVSVTDRRVDAVSGSVESSTVGVLNAAGFTGVDRTGVSDSAAGLSAAFTAAAGGKLLLPFGTYKILSALTIPTSGLTLVLDDAELDFSSVAASSTLLAATGSKATAVNLTAGPVAGATSVSVAAGAEAGFSAGDIVKITAADVFDPGRTASTVGEQAVVLSTASGVINLRSPLMGSYSTTPQVAKVTRTQLVMKGTGQVTGGGSGSSHTGLSAKWADRLRLEGLQFRGCELMSIALWDCIDFDISVDVEGSSSSGTGYGVSTTNACQWGRVHHSSFRDCRHALSTNNSSTDGGGMSRHLTYDHITVRDSSGIGDAVDCHAAAEYINYDHVDVYDAGGSGFNIECPKANLKACKVFGAAVNGIYLLNCAAAAAEYRVEGCEIYDTVQYGVRYKPLASGGSSTPKILDIIDNEMIRCVFGAAFADPSSEHRLVGARMNENRAVGCGAGTGGASFYMLQADASEVCDNSCIEQPNGVIGTRVNDFTRGKWKGNLVSDVSAGTVRSHYGVGVVDSDTRGNISRNATGVGGKGLELDATSSGCSIDTDGLRSATTPLTLNGVTSHFVRGADRVELYSTDANKATTPTTDAMALIHSATLTANRTVTIATTGAYAGQKFRVTRTGSGAFNLTVAGIKNLATSQWVEVMFDGSAWVETAFGSL